MPRNFSPWMRPVAFGAVAFALAGAAFIGYRSWSADGNGDVPVFAGKSEAARADEALLSLERRVQDNPTDIDVHLELANAYLQKAREFGDPSLYSAAENLLEKAEQLDPTNPEVFASQGILAGARHEFRLALNLGQKALAIDPERARYWGVVADAQIELGMYDEAIVSLQEMVDRRPDFASYSRVSYARELYGDIEGAIEAMQFAIEAGSSNQGDLAWAHAQVGNLYLNLNNTNAAAAAYESAEMRVANYHGSLAGRAKLAIAAGDLSSAASLFEKAFAAVPLAEYAIAHGEILLVQDDEAGAARQFELVRAIDQLSAGSGINTDLELAQFEIERGTDPAGALRRARAAYAAQPSVHAADALAWALFRSGNVAEATLLAEQALQLGSRDPLKLFHAAEIFRAAGDNERAFTYLEEALRLNPNFSVLHREEAARTLVELRELAA